LVFVTGLGAGAGAGVVELVALSQPIAKTAIAAAAVHIVLRVRMVQFSWFTFRSRRPR
jgi:hypothetical protein